jgi:hypothetical protein
MSEFSPFAAAAIYMLSAFGDCFCKYKSLLINAMTIPDTSK